MQKSNRLSVVQVIPAFTVGGAEWMASLLACKLDTNLFQSAVISLHPPKNSPMEAMLRKHKVPVYYVNKKSGFDISAFLKLSQILRSLRPHIVHTHQTVGRYVYPVCWVLRPQLIVHTIHSLAHREIRSRLWRNFQAFAYRYGGVHPISIAHEVSKTFHKEYRRRPAALIPNGIPTDRFQVPPSIRLQWRLQEGYHRDEVLFVCVAGLRPAKNHMMLLEAWQRASKDMPAAELLLVGAPDREHPELAETLKQRVVEWGLEHSVRFLGQRSDIPEILAASDVFVLSSHYEGNPLSVMEAMAAGLPIVATAVGGVPELVPPEAGILVPSGAVQEFAQALQHLYQHPDLRGRMGCEARHLARERFDVTAMARAYGQFYLETLKH